MTKKSSKNQILEFKTRAEAARFFDTHDMAGYQSEFKTVRAKFSQSLSEGVTVRLDQPTLMKLRTQAHKTGVGPTTLARMWLIEKLQTV